MPKEAPSLSVRRRCLLLSYGRHQDKAPVLEINRQGLTVPQLSFDQQSCDRRFQFLLNEALEGPGPVDVDVTGLLGLPDEEIFAPVLQVTRVESFDDAVLAANATRYGLSAGLISGDEAIWRRFMARIRAGVVNWNRPTTGAAGDMPFGGLGASGNHRPSAYYAADYCAYPVASFEASEPKSVLGEMKGVRP